MGKRHKFDPGVQPEDWAAWEQRLARGVEPSEAAAMLGFTCSQFRRSDQQRHAEALAGSREARGYLVDRMVEADVAEFDEQAGEQRYRPDVSDTMKLAHARRWQPAYAAQNVTVAGSVEMEGSGELATALERLEQTLAAARVRAVAGAAAVGVPELAVASGSG